MTPYRCSTVPVSIHGTHTLNFRGQSDSTWAAIGDIVPDLLVSSQLVHGALVPDDAIVDDVGAVTHLHGEADILLGEEDADAALLQPQDPVPDRPHHERGQAFGRLVEDKQPGVGGSSPRAAG